MSGWKKGMFRTDMALRLTCPYIRTIIGDAMRAITLRLYPITP